MPLRAVTRVRSGTESAGIDGTVHPTTRCCSAVSAEHVVGQREQRAALGRGGGQVEAFPGGRRVLDRLGPGVLRRPILPEQEISSRHAAKSIVSFSTVERTIARVRPVLPLCHSRWIAASVTLPSRRSWPAGLPSAAWPDTLSASGLDTAGHARNHLVHHLHGSRNRPCAPADRLQGRRVGLDGRPDVLGVGLFHRLDLRADRLEYLFQVGRRRRLEGHVHAARIRPRLRRERQRAGTSGRGSRTCAARTSAQPPADPIPIDRTPDGCFGKREPAMGAPHLGLGGGHRLRRLKVRSGMARTISMIQRHNGRT